MKNSEQKTIMSAVLIFGVMLFASAQEALFAPGTVVGWEAVGAGTVSGDAKEKAVICSGKSNMELFSKNAAKIDPSKSYGFTGMFKSEVGSATFKCYFGLSPLNEKGELISSNQINFIKDTGTELASDCSPDDTTLKIKNGENWKPGQYCCIAFDTDNSGKYEDLPNGKLSSAGILNVEKKDGFYEVAMKNRCNVKYLAGTKIRIHSAGPSAIYGGSGGKTVTSEWTEIKGLVKPEVVENMNLLVNWWPGVQKVKFFVAFYPEKPDSSITVSFKDVKLEEIK
jgi:hypothetical protein